MGHPGMKANVNVASDSRNKGLVKEVSFEQHTIPGTEAVPLTGYNVQQLWLQLFAA